MAAGGSLNVIALVSGGKDSFFSVLHCLANGHRVVALANLHPPSPAPLPPSPPGTGPDRPGEDAASACQGGHPSYDDSSPGRARAVAPVPGHGSGAESCGPGPLAELERLEEADLNSFMYQTVGHEVVPLYAAATGLPLYRRPISGTAVDHGASYQNPPLARPSSPRISGTAPPSGIAPGGNEDVHRGPSKPGLLGSQDTAPGCDVDAAGHEDNKPEDETESLVPLLRTVMAAHPEANALCTGAILSTYQRTRVESVALRLGLVPLAYLWQYPALPLPVCPDGALAPRAHGHGHHDDAQLLRDMAMVGLDARIIKVASAGLNEGILWQNVASEASIQRIQRALRRFGGGGRGSVLGEGGEFETLVVDGPHALFKKRIVVPEDGKRIVQEGGGSLWLGLRQARVDPKPPAAQGQDLEVRIPGVLDSRFEAVVTALGAENRSEGEVEDLGLTRLPLLQEATPLNPPRPWCFVGGSEHVEIAEQTAQLVADIRQRLESQALPTTAITNSVILLRRMSDFPAINQLYGALFPQPSPPARVTVACGACLPAGCGIAIFLTVQPALLAAERQGLHVQSRSYWAPANIGPYSQAVGFPIGIVPVPSGVLTAEREADEAPLSQGAGLGALQAISIAGQIPLVPATMVLPQGSGDSATIFQITLALQHLWRVGAEMRVQWWTSAVAYFPRAASPIEMKHQAWLAGRAWEAAHVWFSASDDDDDENGPDLWDRKFNPQYMSLAGGGSGEDADGAVGVPDWEVVHGFDAEEEDAASRRRRVPFAFAAEVEELPRAAGVEWHAHLGLAKADVGSVRVARTRTRVRGPAEQERDLALHHVVARSSTTGGSVFVHTTAALATADASPAPAVNMGDVTDAVAARVDECLRDLLQNPGREGEQPVAATRPYLSYAATAHVVSSAPTDGATIPCHTLWDSRGDSLSAVLLFQNHYNVTR